MSEHESESNSSITSEISYESYVILTSSIVQLHFSDARGDVFPPTPRPRLLCCSEKNATCFVVQHKKVRKIWRTDCRNQLPGEWLSLRRVVRDRTPMRRNEGVPFQFGLTFISHPDFCPDISRSEEHTSELQSLMRISYDVF